MSNLTSKQIEEINEKINIKTYFLVEKYCLRGKKPSVIIKSGRKFAPYTDSVNIYVSLDSFLNLPLKKNSDVDLNYKRIISHELGHVNFSMFENFENFCMNMQEKYLIPPAITQIIYNILEDCRIEKMMSDEFPELKSVYNECNKKSLENKKNELENSEASFLNRFIFMTMNYALTSDDEAFYSRINSDDFKEIIDAARNEKRKEVVRNHTEDFLKKMLPVLIVSYRGYSNTMFIARKIRIMQNEELSVLLQEFKNEISKMKEEYKQTIFEDIDFYFSHFNDIKIESMDEAETEKDNDNTNSIVMEIERSQFNKYFDDVNEIVGAKKFKIEKVDIEFLKYKEDEKARKLKKEIENLFLEKNKLNLKSQNKGIIDVNKLAYIKTNLSRNVFFRKNEDKSRNYSISILVDGSKSMGKDNKMKCALKAVEKLENALKEFADLRITIFRANEEEIKTLLIKDFEDTKDENYTYSYAKKTKHEVNGSNAEYINIKIETEILKKQPCGKKMMLILGDGLTKKNSETDDVKYLMKKNIKYVRRQGIIPIFVYIPDFINKDDRIYEISKEIFGSRNVIKSYSMDIEKNIIDVIRKFII